MSSSHVPLMLSRSFDKTDHRVRSLSPLSRDAVSSRSVPFAGTLSTAFIFYEHDARGATSTLAGARPADPAAHQATAQRQARGPEEPASPLDWSRLEPSAVVRLVSEGRRGGKPSRWAPS